jgi:hypothetical protein
MSPKERRRQLAWSATGIGSSAIVAPVGFVSDSVTVGVPKSSPPLECRF